MSSNASLVNRKDSRRTLPVVDSSVSESVCAITIRSYFWFEVRRNARPSSTIRVTRGSW